MPQVQPHHAERRAEMKRLKRFLSLLMIKLSDEIDPPELLESPDGFRTYDTSRGHCPFCGRLPGSGDSRCHGRCFK